jgi:hypothetical protein
MSAISTHSFGAWIAVETKHGSRLEFVLRAADDRNGRPHHHEHVFTTYTDRLWDMLKKEFKRSKSIDVREKQEYGDVMFYIQANTLKELQSAIVRSERVTQRWVNKYRVNIMREEDE